MSFSNYMEKALLDFLNQQGTAYTPTTKFVALYKNDPGEANTGTEVSATVDDTAYARQAISFGAATLGTGIALSSNAQTFAAVVYGSGATAYTVTHIGIFDAATNGQLLAKTALGASVSRLVGKTLVFDIGAITVALD
jgi:hypothetical protein